MKVYNNEAYANNGESSVFNVELFQLKNVTNNNNNDKLVQEKWFIVTTIDVSKLTDLFDENCTDEKGTNASTRVLTVVRKQW